MGQCEEAVKVLMRANDLAINQKINFGDAITAQLRAAKRDQFRKEEERRFHVYSLTYFLQSFLKKGAGFDMELKFIFWFWMVLTMW